MASNFPEVPSDVLDESSEKAWNAAAPPTPATPPRTRAPTSDERGQAALARLGGGRLRVRLRVGLGYAGG